MATREELVKAAEAKWNREQLVKAAEAKWAAENTPKVEPGALEKVEAFGRGAASGLSAGLLEPVFAGAGTLGSALGEQIAKYQGLDVQEKPMGELYQEEVERIRKQKEELPGYSVVGEIAGALSPVGAGASIMRGVQGALKVGKEAGALATIGKSALTGAASAGAEQAIRKTALEETGLAKPGELPGVLETAKGAAQFGASVPASIMGVQKLMGLGAKGLLSLVRVKESDVKYLMDNFERLKGAKTLEETKELFDDAIARVKGELDSAILTEKQATEAVADFKKAYQEKAKLLGQNISADLNKADLELDSVKKAMSNRLREAKAPTHLANDIEDAKSTLKELLVDKSKQSYQILEKSKERIAVPPILQFLKDAQQQAKVKGVSLSKADDQMIGELNSLASRFKKLGTTITMTEAKEVLRKLDQMVDYNVAKGEFSPALEQTIKQLRGSIRNTIGELVPEFDEFMKKEVVPIAELREQMVGYFKNADQARGKLGSIHMPQNQGAREALEKTQNLLGVNFMDSINEWSDIQKLKGTPSMQEAMIRATPEYQTQQKAKAAQEAYQAQDLKKMAENAAALSQEQKALEAAQAQRLRLEQAVEPFKNWNEMNSWNKLQTFDRAKSNPEIAKRIKLLDQMTDSNFEQMAKDALNNLAFEREAIQGSRANVFMLALGGLAGSLITGDPSAVGTGMGLALLGPLVERYGAGQVKKAVTAFMTIKGTPTFQKVERATADLSPGMRQEVLNSFRRSVQMALVQKNTIVIPEEERAQAAQTVRESDLPAMEQARIIRELQKTGKLTNAGKVLMGNEADKKLIEENESGLTASEVMQAYKEARK